MSSPNLFNLRNAVLTSIYIFNGLNILQPLLLISSPPTTGDDL